MNYVVFRNYNGLTLGGQALDLQTGEEFETIGDFIARNNAAICRIGSMVANQHFANNFDGNGIERGQLTYHIAYDSQLTTAQAELIRDKYPQFLQPYDALLFSQEFFDADIETLRTLAAELDGIQETEKTVIETVESFTTAAPLAESLQQISNTLDSIITGGD